MKLLETISLDVALFVVQWTRMADNVICCRITFEPESKWEGDLIGQARCGNAITFNQRYGMWLSLKRCFILYKLRLPTYFDRPSRTYFWQRFHELMRLKGLYLTDKSSQQFKKIPENLMPGKTYFYDGENYMVKEIALFKGTKKDPKKWKKVVIYTDYASKFINTYVRDFSTFTSKYRPCPPKDQKMPS